MSSAANNHTSEAWAQLDIIPVSKSCRVIKLLDIRAFELKSDVHDVFDHVWNTLVHVDRERGCLSVYGTREGEDQGSCYIGACF